jgi:acyl-CoA synthetase (AMP-forming)/AMP-acid ligase II
MTDEVVITRESTIPEILKIRCAIQPEQEVLILEEERVTYGDFYARVQKMAAVLEEIGVKPGEKVAIVLPNNIRFPVVMYAIFEVGGVVVAVNPTYTTKEIKHLLVDSQAVVAIVAEKVHRANPLAKIESIRADLPHLRHVLVDGPNADPAIRLDDRLEKAKVKGSYHQADANDLAALIYTSGTTGAPKGSMHSHRTLLFPLTMVLMVKPSLPQMIQMVRRYGFGYLVRLIKTARRPFKLLYTTPPYAGAGITVAVNFILTGRTIVIQENFSTTEAIRLIEKEQVSIFGGTPALTALLLKDSELAKRDMSSVVYFICAASYVSPALVDEIKEKIGAPTVIGYGCTEVVGGPTATDAFSDSDRALRETVGSVTPGYEVKIVDENRQPLGTNEVGEIALRSGSVMLGYYKDEELTRQVIDEDGWYYSGDLGSFDEEGYLRIAGRIKDMIIRAGQNIYPAELEDVLVKYPKVEYAAVVGVPDDIAGERVEAFVIPSDQQDLSKVELMEYCRENLAPYKVPHNIHFIEEFPMTPSGKVLKRELRQSLVG